MRHTLATSLIGAALAVSATQGAHATFYFVADLSNWVTQSGGTPVQANLFNYLSNPFATQQVPDTIFADLGVTMHTTVPLVAHMQTSGTSWYISTDTQGTQIEITFATPQTAIYLTSAVKTTAGEFLQNQSTKSFYAGGTLLGSTVANSAGAISSTPIDRIVVTVNNPSYIPVIGPTFYFVPSPAALSCLLLAPLTARTRRRR